MGARHSRQPGQSGGPWEVEVSYGGEADLHRHLAGCDKNPGHQKFVPVGQFNVDHLPPGCQDNDLVDLVRTVSDLTVRVSVKYVSEGRPETVGTSGKPYPCYKNRGSNMMRVGTGSVRGVVKYTDMENSRYKTCQCQECVTSPSPKTQFALIHINTAAHVVYDSLEAAHTTCHLFFDKGGTPDACSGVVTLSGGSVEVRHVDSDWCEMIFVTHDLGLVDRLDKMVNQRQSLHEGLKEKFDRMKAEKQKSSSQAEDLSDTWSDLIIIVSHPHGCSKQVSVGHCVDTYDGFEGNYAWSYTTATCPGSSGAAVWWVKGRGWGVHWSHGLIHSGKCKDLNYCNNSAS